MSAWTLATGGVADALRRPRLAALLWLVNLTLATVATLPLITALRALLGDAPWGDGLLTGFHVGVGTEVIRALRLSGGLLGPSLAAVAGLALLVGPLLAGGTVEVLTTNDAHPLLHRFGRGAGRLWVRFLAAGLVAMPSALLAAALAGGPWFVVRKQLGDQASGMTKLALGVAGGIGAGLGLLLVLIALDLARIAIARDDSRRPIRLFFRVLRQVLRHPLRTLGVWSWNAAPLLVLLALYLALRAGVRTGGWLTIGLLFVAQQAFAFCRAVLRVGLWSGEIGLLQELMPAVAPVAAPPAPTDEPALEPDGVHEGQPGLHQSFRAEGGAEPPAVEESRPGDDPDPQDPSTAAA
jgi:hypothetical protein